MLKISVIMPVYNAGTYLNESIKSILSQTYGDFEFVIVNDGSTDNSVEIIKSFSDERIKLVTTEHAGIVAALNEGLRVAQGEYIIRADADDVSVPERFEKLLGYMEQNMDIGVCGSWAVTIDEHGMNIGEMKYPPIKSDEIKKYTLLHFPFIHPSLIIKKSILDEVGGYKNIKHEDYELWTRIFKKHKAHNIPEFLIKYRIHTNQITNKHTLEKRFYSVYVRILALLRY